MIQRIQRELENSWRKLKNKSTEVSKYSSASCRNKRTQFSSGMDDKLAVQALQAPESYIHWLISHEDTPGPVGLDDTTGPVGLDDNPQASWPRGFLKTKPVDVRQPPFELEI